MSKGVSSSTLNMESRGGSSHLSFSNKFEEGIQELMCWNQGCGYSSLHPSAAAAVSCYLLPVLPVLPVLLEIETPRQEVELRSECRNLMLLSGFLDR